MEKHIEIPTNNGVIRGMVHYPENQNQDRLTVIIIHGYFSANRVGPARLYVLLGRCLSKHGFVVIRCDIIGVGDSDGDFSDVTFETEIRDFRIICNRAKELCKDNDLVLIGHSMGANIALRLAHQINSVKKLLLLSPEVRLIGGIDTLFIKEQQERLKNDGFVIRKGLHINSSFINELRAQDPILISQNLKIPFTVIQGDQNELYDPDGAKALTDANPKGRYVKIPGGDHNFLKPEVRKHLFDEILKALR